VRAAESRRFRGDVGAMEQVLVGVAADLAFVDPQPQRSRDVVVGQDRIDVLGPVACQHGHQPVRMRAAHGAIVGLRQGFAGGADAAAR
jgi:hypothetical protein